MRAPATLNEAVALVRAAAPGVDLGDVTVVEGGWDSFVLDTGSWIFRFPRHAHVEPALRAEIALLPQLGPALPLAIPQFEHVVEEPVLFAGYRKIEREQLTRERQTAGSGHELAAFLVALHSFPVEVAVAAGVPSYGPESWGARHEDLFTELLARVGPLLAAPERAAAEAMFDEFLAEDLGFVPSLVHYDLGPTHVLAAAGGSLTGIIDWGDAAVGDPAADLAWALHGTAPAFAAALAEAYGASEDMRRRALLYHRLGPWHEVVHGQDAGDDSWIESGLLGVLDRLPREPGAGR